MEPVSIVVANYNGRDLLERTLPPLVDAFDPDGDGRELIMVDDGSQDESVAFVRERFPLVHIEALKKNSGFIAAANLGVERARHRIVILLALHDLLIVHPRDHQMIDPVPFAPA